MLTPNSPKAPVPILSRFLSLLTSESWPSDQMSPLSTIASSEAGDALLHHQMHLAYSESLIADRKRTSLPASSPISTNSRRYLYSMPRTANLVPNTDSRHENMDGIIGREKTSATGSWRAVRLALDGIRSFTRTFNLVEHSARRDWQLKAWRPSMRFLYCTCR